MVGIIHCLFSYSLLDYWVRMHVFVLYDTVLYIAMDTGSIMLFAVYDIRF